jgi:3-oxoacyl-[acyl-carrier-protein] synthase II
VFDTPAATSTRNDSPGATPRPFDRDRDGLVVGEGAATLVLEEHGHAVARGARIHAEIVGFATNSDGAHVTEPEVETMSRVMTMALEDAGLSPAAIGYVSAHGTATGVGDIAESRATRAVLGGHVPISSMKSYIAPLRACGAIEAWWGVEMQRRGWFANHQSGIPIITRARLRRVETAWALDASFYEQQFRVRRRKLVPDPEEVLICL